MLSPSINETCPKPIRELIAVEADGKTRLKKYLASLFRVRGM